MQISNHPAVSFAVGVTWWRARFQFEAWTMAHKGKATSDVHYNPEDPPEAYSNSSIHTRLTEYTAMQGRSMGQSTIPSPRTLMEKSS